MHYCGDGLWQLSQSPWGICTTMHPRHHHGPCCLCCTPPISHGHTQSCLKSPTASNFSIFPCRPRLMHPCFVRRDSVKRPLQPPYDGPFRVISRNPKYYHLAMRGKVDTVSVDRLKPAHRDTQPLLPHPIADAQQPPPLARSPSPPSTPAATTTSSPTPLPKPPSASTQVSTRVGRRVRFPKHLQDYIR